MQAHKVIIAAMLVAAMIARETNCLLQAKNEPQEEPAAEPYSFSYSSESAGAVSSRQESGDASGRVTGFYTILGDDGRERRVDYVADENGYRANVRTNEIGTRQGLSADAQFEVQAPSAQQLEAAKVTYEQYKYLEDAHLGGQEQSRLRPPQQQQQAQQVVYQTPFTNNQQVANQQQQLGADQDWKARSAALSLNKRGLEASEQLAQIKGSRVQQPQRVFWQTNRPAKQNTVLQQQLEQQFVQQANQLGRQDYPRQEQAVQPFGQPSPIASWSSAANQSEGGRFQQQQQLPTFVQQGANAQQLLTGSLSLQQDAQRDFGQQFAGQQQSNIIGEIADQQDYAAVSVDRQQGTRVPVRQQVAANNSISKGFTVVNLSENEEPVQTVRPAPIQSTEAPLAVFVQQPQRELVQQQVREQQVVVTQPALTVGSIQTEEVEQQVVTRRPTSVNQIIFQQEQQQVGVKQPALIMRPLLATTTTTTTTTTQRPETTTLAQQVYYQPTTTIQTTTRRPVVTTTSLSIKEAAGQQQVKGGYGQTNWQSAKWDQQLVSSRQPAAWPQRSEAPVTVAPTWQQQPSVVRLESGAPKVEYWSNNQTIAQPVLVKGTKGGSARRAKQLQFWQRGQSQSADGAAFGSRRPSSN